MADIQKLNVNNTTYDISTTWAKVTGKPSTFTPSSHTHTASEVSGLPTKLSAFTNDVGYITGITKSMVEGVLTGNITSHTHSYLPLSGGTLRSASPPLYINRINGFSSITYQVDDVTVGVLGFNQNGDLITRPKFQSNTNYYNIIHSGNYNSYAPTLTGTGASGTWGINISGNAATVGGYSVTTNNNTPWGTIPYISKIGVMDVGKSFEFHFDNTTGSDFSTVLFCTGDYGNIVKLPSADGTLALLTDNVASATKLQTARTIWGKSFDGTGDVSGNISMGYSEIYWNGDANGSYISSNGTTDMIYDMRNGHIFRVGGDRILIIKRYGNYNLQVDGSANATTLYENGTRVSLSGHTHDDRYYTESEVTNLLAGKANSSHGTHLSGSAALYSNSSSGSNCNDVTYNLIGYYTSNGPSTSLGASTNDGTLYSQAYSSSWVSQIAQDYRNGNLFTRGKNNGTWTAWKAVSYNGHTHKYAGSSSAGGAATSVVVTDSNANSTYRMVWHSGNSLYSTDNIYCNPSTDYLYSKGFYQTSDELLKTFYDPIKPDLEKLRKLRKNYFKFNDKDKLEIGVSAQEIQSIYPEIVSTDDNGYLSVAYDKLSVIALAAIDELDNKYKKEINDLKDQLDAIKNILNEKGIV